MCFDASGGCSPQIRTNFLELFIDIILFKNWCLWRMSVVFEWIYSIENKSL